MPQASSIAHVFRKHKDVLFSSRDELALTLLILYEKLDQGDGSFWKPMIDILPADPGAASKWSEEELQELQDESLKAEAMIVVASMQQTYQRVLRPILEQHGDVFTVDRYTWEEFRWALLCVESRTFGRFLPHPSIVPFADLLNHVNVQTSYRWLPDERRAAYMCDASGEHVHRKGEEAFMSYGPRSNAELLLHYGFALQSNRYEVRSSRSSSRSRRLSLLTSRPITFYLFLSLLSCSWSLMFSFSLQAVELHFRINTLHHSKNIPCTKIFKTCLRPQVPPPALAYVPPPALMPLLLLFSTLSPEPSSCSARHSQLLLPSLPLPRSQPHVQVPCLDLIALFRKFALDKSLWPSGKGGGSFTHEELRQKCLWDAKMEEEALSLLRKVSNAKCSACCCPWRELHFRTSSSSRTSS